MTEQNETVLQNEQNDQEEFELSHSDKLVGIFTEPVRTFTHMAKFPPKTKDWIFPLLMLIVVTVISSVLMMSNPIIKQSIIEKQQAEMQKMVDNGTISQEQVDAQMQASEKFMEGPIFIIVQVFSITIGLFLVFFIVSGFYFLFVKWVLKGDGSFKAALVSYGLPAYISIIQAIIMVILALLTDKLLTGTSIATLLEMSTKDIGGFILSKIDPLTIWFYVVFGVGLAKMFKSENTKMYVLSVLGVWMGINILLYFIAMGVPFIGRFIGIV